MPDLADKPEAVQAITYALNSENCVLQFKEDENGQMRIIDVTDHFEAMEELVEDG